MRVTFCWAEVSGYMAACWRALGERHGVDVQVIHPEKLWGKTNPFLAEPALLQGISHEMFDADTGNISNWLTEAIEKRQPDVIVLCGWVFRPYFVSVNSARLRNVPVVVGMDSPWRGSLAQRLARFRLARLVRRLALVVTTGERSREYARRIGIQERRIRSGYYGFDYERFSAVADQRSQDPSKWPRQFLFTGRYVAQKDLPTLVAAYSAYRDSVSEPWGLTCCGTGEDGVLLKGIPGVVDAGFTQPADLPSVFASHGAFILPSKFEPWGVVLAEAAASGLPLLCTSACGAGDDLVRPYYNGLVVAPQDVAGLTHAMRWMHENQSLLPEMGRRGRGLAEAFSADAWAARWHNYFLEILDRPTGGNDLMT